MRAGQILRLAARGYVDAHAEHLRPHIINTLNGLLATADTFNADLAATQADGKLSPEGMAEGSIRVAVAALDKLRSVEATTIQGLSQQASVIEADILRKVTHAAPSDPVDRLRYDLQLQEIRNQLRQLPAAERANVYRTTNDPLVVAAFDSAPATLSAKRADGSQRLEPFIDPDVRVAAALARAERADPVAQRKLAEVRSVQQAYTLAVSSVRAEILRAVPQAAAAQHAATA